MNKFFAAIFAAFSIFFGSAAFASPTGMTLSYTYSGTTGQVTATVKLIGGKCRKGCDLRLRAALSYEGLGTTGAAYKNLNSIKFKGNKTSFRLTARSLPKVLAYRGQAGKLTLQARLLDNDSDDYLYSDAIAHFVICGTGRTAVSRQTFLNTLQSRLKE